MSYSDIGVSFQFPSGADQFRKHVRSRGVFKGCKGITFHHTWSPSLADRPDGLTDQHIRNVRDYYRDHLGWSFGPHFFADDHRIMALTPISEHGVHARSFNATHLGIEVLGNYDKESPFEGRGAKCWENATLAASILMAEGGLSSYNFHRDDPKSDKSCPGTRITKAMVKEWLDKANGYTVGDIPEKPLAGDSPLVLIPGPVFWHRDIGLLMVPIAAFLRGNGIDAAWDSGTWGQLKVEYYDKATETSYGSIAALMELVRQKKGEG